MSFSKINWYYFVIGKEPNKNSHPKAHLVWEQIYQSSVFKFVDDKEVSSLSLSQYMEEHEVQPYYPKD